MKQLKYFERIERIEVLLFRFLDSQLALNSRLIINNIYSALGLNPAYFMYSNIAIISPGLLYQIDTKNSHLQYQTIKSRDSSPHLSNLVTFHTACQMQEWNWKDKENLIYLDWRKSNGTSGPRSGLRLPLRGLVFISTRNFHSVQKLCLSSKSNREMHWQVSNYLRNHNLEILILLFQLCKAEVIFSITCSLTRQQRNWRWKICQNNSRNLQSF